MSENYIVINGKKAELTEDQLEKLGIKPEKSKYEEMFERKYNENYYFIDSQGTLNRVLELSEIGDDKYFNIGNYCRNESIMEQRALHETLNRLLWRASIEAGELKNSWDDNKHFYIVYQLNLGDDWLIDSHESVVANQIYFPTKEAARNAIDNIIIPFIKEHPDFVW